MIYRLITTHHTLDFMQRWFDNNGDTSFFPAAAWLGYHPDVIHAKLHEFVATGYRLNGTLGTQVNEKLRVEAEPDK